MSPYGPSAMGASRVEASIFGESALIDRVCYNDVVHELLPCQCCEHSFLLLLSNLVDTHHGSWMFVLCYGGNVCFNANTLSVGNGQSFLGMWKFEYLVREPDTQA